jgi:hypothetical protein
VDLPIFEQRSVVARERGFVSSIGSLTSSNTLPPVHISFRFLIRGIRTEEMIPLIAVGAGLDIIFCDIVLLLSSTWLYDVDCRSAFKSKTRSW